MKTPRRGIIAGGNWIVDITNIIDVFPAQDALANILGEQRGNGGSAYNVLIDLARLQASLPLEAIGLVGDDPEGQDVLRDCGIHGIDTAQLRVCSKARTSYTQVMLVKSSGRRTFFHQRGANALLGPEHFDFSKSSAKIFHLGYLLLLDKLDEPHPNYGTVAAGILAEAQKAGFKTSIDIVSEDSSRFAAVVMPALRYTDYAIMNEFEAERITGLSIRTEQGLNSLGLRTAMLRLFEAGVREWVVIHFPEGSVVANRESRIFHQASVRLPPEKIAGATGAGDAFCAGLLVGLHEKKPMEECLRYAVNTAAACMLDATSSAGLRPLGHCLELGRQYGFQNWTL